MAIIPSLPWVERPVPSDLLVFVQSVAHKQRAVPTAVGRIGEFLVPTRVVSPSGPAWAADNNAFVGFDECAFLRMLRRIVRGIRCEGWPPPAFITMPDVVADHASTLRLFIHWHRVMALPELPRAFVLQDGAEAQGWRSVPWDFCEALFIGGTDGFKLGHFAAQMAAIARSMGKWVHMGRVNSIRRATYARSIGCHSIDGSGLNRFPSSQLTPVIQSMRQRLLSI